MRLHTVFGGEATRVTVDLPVGVVPSGFFWDGGGMKVVLAQDHAHAVDSHLLTLRMCVEMAYAERPPVDDFVAYVLAERENMSVFVAYADDGLPAGQVIMTRGFDPYIPGYFGVMKTMYVVPEHRKEGVADLLVATLMVEAKLRGYKGVQWYVYKSNGPSLGFFSRLGFVPKEQDEMFEFWLPMDRMGA